MSMSDYLDHCVICENSCITEGWGNEYHAMVKFHTPVRLTIEPRRLSIHAHLETDGSICNECIWKELPHDYPSTDRDLVFVTRDVWTVLLQTYPKSWLHHGVTIPHDTVNFAKC